MSAMHAGIMTTSTEMMYAQLVTLTCIPPGIHLYVRGKIAVCQRHILEGVSLYASFYEHIEWPPVRHWLSDATPNAIGGFCWESRGLVAV